MKTGFWLKGGKGKLAGATVYQQNGETVIRIAIAALTAALTAMGTTSSLT